jgi:hypothetical protein
MNVNLSTVSRKGIGEKRPWHISGKELRETTKKIV